MHQNSCLAWLAVESDVVHYKEICEKHLRSNYVQTLWRYHLKTHKMGNLQHTSIVFSLLMWCFKLMHHLMAYILPWVTEKSQEAGASIHMLGPLQWLYNAQTLFCIYVFLPRNVWGFFGVFFYKIYHPGSLLLAFALAWRFEMIQNRSCLTRKWCTTAGIELNAMIGQLV